MFAETAEVYDMIYAGFKDYRAEAAQIAAIVRSEQPAARTVLDVACGSGEHARALARDFDLLVDGLDLEPAFIRIAHAKHPTGRFHVADMTAFSLPTRYDAILCLFSSIGYVRSIERVRDALCCFRDHLEPGGVIIVEPWFPPGVLQDGSVSRHTSEAEGVRVERESCVTIRDRVSRIRFDYRIHGPDGVRPATEIHELGLFTPEEMHAAFEASGLMVRHDPAGLTGRGLYVARRAP